LLRSRWQHCDELKVAVISLDAPARCAAPLERLASVECDDVLRPHRLTTGAVPHRRQGGRRDRRVHREVTEVLDKINFDGVIDDIWAIRSSGFVHPELQ